MKKLIAIAATISAASLGFAPAAFAGGAAGAVGVHLNHKGKATNVAAAGAIGDGTSLAGVRLKTTPTIVTTTDYYYGRKKKTTESADCKCTTQETNAFALNTDGDVEIAAINGIASDVNIKRSGLSRKQVGKGKVHINADIDVDVDVDAQLGFDPDVHANPRPWKPGKRRNRN